MPAHLTLVSNNRAPDSSDISEEQQNNKHCQMSMLSKHCESDLSKVLNETPVFPEQFLPKNCYFVNSGHLFFWKFLFYKGKLLPEMKTIAERLYGEGFQDPEVLLDFMTSFNDALDEKSPVQCLKDYADTGIRPEHFFKLLFNDVDELYDNMI